MVRHKSLIFLWSGLARVKRWPIVKHSQVPTSRLVIAGAVIVILSFHVAGASAGTDMSEFPVQAYIDPGTGSFLIQIVIAGLAGVGYAVKIFLTHIRHFLSKLVLRRQKTNNDN